jgi:hypothetical protein
MGLIILGSVTLALVFLAVKNLRPPHYDAVAMLEKDAAYYEVAGRVMARKVNEAYPDSTISIIGPPAGVEMDDRESAFLAGFLEDNKRPINGPVALVLPAAVMARLSNADLADYAYHLDASMLDNFAHRECQGDTLILALLQLPQDAAASRLFGREGGPLWLLMQDQRYVVDALIRHGKAALALSIRPNSNIWSLPAPRRRNLQKVFDARFHLLSTGANE